MKDTLGWRSVFFLLLMAATAVAPLNAQDGADIQNPNIDMAGHLKIAMQAAEHRESRRVSEKEFMRMSAEPETIVLDARSQQKYDELHVKGAINLSFPDITIESLQRTIPDKTTRILIYCNNNFRNAESAFPLKSRPTSLNLSTYITLYSYGYENVYELGPLIDIDASKLTFEPPLNSFWEKTKRKLHAMGREISVVSSVRNSQRSIAGLYYGFP